jgi:site-specific DNA-methyltransferase (adenine-specific)
MILNKIYCMDNIKGIKNYILDNSIDLTITSPPYDNLRDYKVYNFDFENLAKELYRITKDRGVVVWIVGDSIIDGSETGTSFKQALYFKEIGFNLHDTMIYERQNRFPEFIRYNQIFEYMFILSKGKIKTFNPIKDKKNQSCYNTRGTVRYSKRDTDGKLHKIIKENDNQQFSMRGNIWRCDVGNNKSSTDKFAFEHPAIFPEKLVRDHLLSWSNEQDVILDPFMGSGTTAKMCVVEKRNYIGFEISQEYIDIAQKRLQSINYDWVF